MRTKEQTSAQNRAYHARHRDEILARQGRVRRERKIGADARLWHLRKLLADAKRRAKQRGLAFDLTIVDLHVPDECPVFGLTLAWANANRRTWSSPSLDRIDSRLGYVASNVWIVSWRANQIKSDATPKELRAVARAVEVHLRSERKPGGIIDLPYLDGVQWTQRPVRR